MNPKISMLSAEAKSEIHARSLEILEKVGIRFHSRKVCQILQEAGCEVDWDKLSARIPRSLVEAGLATLPSRFTLAARDPEKDIDAGGGTPWYTSSGLGLWFKDLETGERRPSTYADLVQCAQLIDALDEVDEWCPMVAPTDLPTQMMEVKILEATLLHTRKHFLGGGTDAAAAPFLGEMLDAVLGDRKTLKQRPYWTWTQSPISPLQNDGSTMELVLDWADCQIPILLQFLPLAGGTAPVTLEGTILQENANFLGNMAFYQLVSPGWPIIWGATAGTMDMRTGRWSGRAESILMSLALTEMAKTVYQLPASTFGQCSINARSIDFESGIDAILSDAMLGSAGVDNIWGPADLDGATLVDLDYIVLTLESIRTAKRLRQGLTIDAEHLLTDLILEQGFDANYLGHKTTAKRFRKEHLLADLLPCISYEDWEQSGKTDRDIARERLMKILDACEAPEHPPEVLK